MSEHSAHRPLVFGVLNVTPDSFSDGGRWIDSGAAIARGRELVRLGADVVDVGGESTRPGAARVSAEVELERVIPVVEALVATGIDVSVDTMRSSTARAAIDAGARYINDVSAGLADSDMAPTIADSEVHYIAMHWRGHSEHMDSLAVYDDVVSDVLRELDERVRVLVDAGVERDRLIVDPGLGFAKTAEHNWELLAGWEALHGLGLRVLVGASRKRFLAAALPENASVTDRDIPTAVISALVSTGQAWGVRVHNVPDTVAALNVVDLLRSGGRYV